MAIIVVVVVAGSGGGDSGGGEPSNLIGKIEVEKLLAEIIPQSGTLLVKRDAAVKISEFGDLPCPCCKAKAEEVMAGSDRTPDPQRRKPAST